MPDRRSDKGRHQARKRAVDLLFEAEARGITAAEGAKLRNTLADSDPEVSALNPYTVTVANGVTEHAAHIDDLISAHLQGWTLERLPAVDRAILRPGNEPNRKFELPRKGRTIVVRDTKSGKVTGRWTWNGEKFVAEK